MVTQTAQTAQAGPSSLRPTATSSSSQTGNKDALISFREIYHHLESARHQRSPEQLEAILRAREQKLRRCASPFAKASQATKSKIAAATVTLEDGTSIRLDEQQRELCEKISDRYDLDHVEALVLLRAFLESEDRSLDLLTRPSSEATSRASVGPTASQPRGRNSASVLGSSVKGKAGKAGSDDLVSDFLDAFNVFYFEERLYVLRSTCALFRIAEDASHKLYDMACDVLSLFADEAFGMDCVQQLERMVAEPLPEQVREQPRYSNFWAKQMLKEQMGLLEVIFLLFYGRIQASPTFVVRFLQSLQTTDVGRQQINMGFFDGEAMEIVACIGHLMVLIGVESLGLEEAMDGIDLSKPGKNKLAKDPAKLGEALDLLEQTGHDPSRSPILLAWSLVLNRLDDALAGLLEQLEEDNAAELPPNVAAMADVLHTDDGGPPVWRRLAQGAFAPEMSLFASMISVLSSPLMATSNSTAALAVSAPSALAYRAVFKGLLLSITELVKPEFLPNFDALIDLWEAAFGSGVAVELSSAASEGIAALCVQLWEIDSHYDSRCATMDTARRRWPVSFRPLLRLIKALSGNSKVDVLDAWPSSLRARARSSTVEQACGSAFQMLAQIPTFAQVLPQGAASLGAPFETLEGGDYTSVSYRVTRPVQVAGTHVKLPAGTTGSTISELGATPVIVLWTPSTPISAWKLMRDILVSFPPYLSDGNGGGDVDARVFEEDAQAFADFGKLAPANADDAWEEIAAEALELFASVLSAGSKLAWGLLAHLDGDDSALVWNDMDVVARESGNQAQGGRSKDLAAVAIHLLQHALVGAPIYSRLVDAGYKLLSILLPYMPNEIWQTIRSSNLLFGSPGSLSYMPSYRSGGDSKGSDGLLLGSSSSSSVLLAHETSRASYAGLLSLLDFLTALVLEMQRSHFVSAAGLLEIKATVLTRGLGWVFESVWPEYQSWRYTKLREKLEIGRRCTALFHLILSETSWKVSSLPNAKGVVTKGPASGLVEALERALVTHPSMLFIAPLVGALGSGQQLIDQLHRAGRQTDAALAESFVLASLQLARLIVSRRRDLTAARVAEISALRSASDGAARGVAAIKPELGLLERLFFDHAAVATRSVSGGGRKSARVELASAVVAYVLLPISSDLSAEAAKLITAVCRSTADVASFGQPVPGLVGHLGTISELESTVAGLVDLVGNSYLDASLRADVWTMLSAIVDTQPALATLLLTGRHLAKTTEFQLEEDSSKQGNDQAERRPLPTVSSTYGQALDRTALEVAADAVLIWQELLRGDPALLESVLRFLDTAWTHASEHVAAFEPVRSRAAFFEALGNLATVAAGVPPRAPDDFMSEDGERLTDADVETREYAYRRMCQARALRLLERDVQLGSSKPSSSSLDVLLGLLTDGDKLRATLETSFKTHCDPALQYECERVLAEQFPKVNLAALRHPTKRDDFDVSRQYGDSYVYDTSVLRRKLEGFYETLSDDDFDDLEALEQGVLWVSTINLEWTKLDVQATCLRAWTQSLQSAMGRLITLATSSSKIDQLEDAVLTAWTACASIAADETLGGDVMRGIHAARIELLSSLMEIAWGRQQAGQKAKGDRVVQISELVARLLDHPVFRVEESIRGLVAPPFHRGCFDLALFCAVQCRHWLRKQDASDVAGETHRALHRAMDAFAKHTIGSLRLAMNNCLVCIQKSRKDSEQARGLEDDLDLLVSLFELVIRNDVGLLPHAWLAQVQEARLFETSIDLLSRAPVLRFDAGREGVPSNSAHHPLFITPVLALLLSLSSQPSSSEQLALAGVVNGLASNMLSKALEAGRVTPLLLSGDRNPSHDCWTAMLRIVVNLIDSLGGGAPNAQWTGASARFIETDVEGFVRVYAKQIENALAFAPIYALASSASLTVSAGVAAQRDPTYQTGMADLLTLAGLDELELICRLFYSMARAETDADGLGSGGASPHRPLQQQRHSLTARLSQRLGWLLQPLVHLLQHPRELQSLLGLDAAPDATRARQLHADAHDRLRRTIGTLLAGLWLHTHAAAVLCRDPPVWPRAHALRAPIAPQLRTAPTARASLGTLLDLAAWLTDRIRTVPAAAVETHDADVATLERAVALCATQAAVWAHGRSARDTTAEPTAADGPASADAEETAARWEAAARQELEAGLARDLLAATRAAEEAVRRGRGLRERAGENAGAWFAVVARFVEVRLGRREF